MHQLPVPLPIIAAAAGAILLSFLLYLLVSLKIEVWRLKKKQQEDSEFHLRACDALESRIAGMEETLREAEARAAVLVPPPSSRSGMNLNKRIQAVKMAKRGERPEQIAAALGLPACEVALMLKVQRLTMSN